MQMRPMEDLKAEIYSFSFKNIIEFYIILAVKLFS